LPGVKVFSFKSGDKVVISKFRQWPVYRLVPPVGPELRVVCSVVHVAVVVLVVVGRYRIHPPVYVNAKLGIPYPLWDLLVFGERFTVSFIRFFYMTTSGIE